jgi:hypothetical protein
MPRVGLRLDLAWILQAVSTVKHRVPEWKRMRFGRRPKSNNSIRPPGRRRELVLQRTG